MARRSCVAAARGANCPRIVNVGLGPGEMLPQRVSQLSGSQREFSRFFPLTSFERITYRESNNGESHLEGLRVDFSNLIQLIKYAGGTLVLRTLQVGVGQRLHRKRLFV